MNMRKWLDDVKKQQTKAPMPILSFPSASLLGVSVKDLTTNSTLQAQGMKAIADRHQSLASVSMMDLSVEAEAFGASVKFSDNEVPVVTNPLVESYDDAENLTVPSVSAGRCPLYVETIKIAKELITDRPIFAGVIGPFSLAGRLMGVSEAMINCYEDPEMVEIVLEKVTEFLISYINEYKKIGANGIVMAEPLCGLLSPDMAEEFSCPYVKEIIDAVQTEEFAFIYHNCGNSVPQIAKLLYEQGAAAYHFGNAVDMLQMLEEAPSDAILMGNIDPVACFTNATPEQMEEETYALLKKCGGYSNFILSSR